CADCLTTSAPRWRVRQDGEKVCNACGLYSYQENDFNSNNYKRQNHFIETDLQFNATNNYEANITDASLKITCADCLTTTSPRWRVRQDGEKVCNACGL
ncbi:hypothetical protein RhiirC2_655382, partial [Rhizophagus irregularis]